MIRAIQDFLLLRRQIVVEAKLPISAVRNYLTAALSGQIVLSGKLHLTRYYQGNLSQNRLRLSGPKDIGNRQFCFLVEGSLSDRGVQTFFDGKMYLSNRDFYRLLCALAVLFGILVVTVRLAVVIAMPVFAVFIYGMVQWHFQHYAREIRQLLVALMAGEEPA